MAAVPKNKRSKAKRNTKRNSFKLNVLSIVECPRCRAKKIAHRVCQACGYYNNEEIIKIEQKSKEKGKEKRTKEAKASKSKPAAAKKEKAVSSESFNEKEPAVS